jgi:hypothetical protein
MSIIAINYEIVNISMYRNTLNKGDLIHIVATTNLVAELQRADRRCTHPDR